MEKCVYLFGNGTADGDGTMRDVLGGKGAGLAEMARAGLPVPPGFTISAEVCGIYFRNGNQVPAEIQLQILDALKALEARTGQEFGSTKNPLFVSVRSGARVSMPGMMDTILNVGLNDKTVSALAAETNDVRGTYNCYRRFIEMYANLVLGVSEHEFDEIFERRKKRAGVQENDLTGEDLEQVVTDYKELVQQRTGKPFPQDVLAQIEGARDAVFRSWFSERAIYYRELHQIPDHIGTAVNVQQMAPADKSGVMFTVDPVHKRHDHMMIECVYGLGEGIVSGVLTPDSYIVNRSDGSSVQEFIPRKVSSLAYISAIGRPVRISEEASEERILNNQELNELRLMGFRAEELFGKPQDVEWCIGDSKLFMLQSRAITTL